MFFLTYRPLVKVHLDGRAVGDGARVGGEHLGDRVSVRTRRLRVDDVLGMLEAHAEKDPTVPGLETAGAAGGAEGFDL